MKKIVIPASSILKYNGATLMKSNVIERASIINRDYLESRNVDASYVFAKVDNVAGSGNGDWETVVSDKTYSYVDTTPSVKTERLLTTSSGSTVSIDGSLELTCYGGISGEGVVTHSINNLAFTNGDSKEWTYSYNALFKQGTFSVPITIPVKFLISYSNGNLDIRAECIHSYQSLYPINKWSATLNVNKISVLSTENVPGQVARGDRLYVYGETTFSLTDSSKIYITPLNSWTNKTEARCSYVKNSSSESTNIENAPVYLFSNSFDSLAAFKIACDEYLQRGSNTVVYLGIKGSNLRISQGHVRFDESFTIYTCTMLMSDAITYNESVSVDIYSSLGTAYRLKEKVLSSGLLDTKNEFEYEVNPLFQESTLIDNNDASGQVLGNVINEYQNGKNITKLTVSYGKYFFMGENSNRSSEIAYSGEDGRFINVDDYCIPYVIRKGEEVPLYKRQNKDPTVFRVTMANPRYNGNFVIDLEMIEVTN